MEFFQFSILLISLAVFTSAPIVAIERGGFLEVEGTIFSRHLLKDSQPQIVESFSQGYMSNAELEEFITKFGQRCCHISNIYSIGKSVNGVPLLVIEISNKPGQEEAEPSFKVIEMEACLQDVNNLSNSIPPRETICMLAEKFSASADRAGKMIVQPKQVLNWFQNRRYAHRTKVKEPTKQSIPLIPRDDPTQFRNVAPPLPTPQGSNTLENVEVEFEAKSVRDGA